MIRQEEQEKKNKEIAKVAAMQSPKIPVLSAEPPLTQNE